MDNGNKGVRLAPSAAAVFRKAKESGGSSCSSLFYGSRVSERTCGICTRTSVQVAIGLFPIDSVRDQFLSPFLLPRYAPPLVFSSSLSQVHFDSFAPPPLYFAARRPSFGSWSTVIAFLSVFCCIDTDRIKETVH